MANGDLFEPNWWQSLLGGVGAALIAWGTGRKIGQQRARRDAEDADYGKTAVSVEAARAEFRLAVEKLREEHEENLELMRQEGKMNREAVYALGRSLESHISLLHRDVIDRTRKGP